MGEPRDSRSQSPHSVAFLAALLVLCSGFGVGAYFVELRGAGMSALLAGEQAPELVILCGAVLAMAVMVQLHVARAARLGNPTLALRSMLGHALTCLEESEDGDGEGLQDLPAEMRDLVGMVAAERSRAEGAKREMQTLRQDMNGLLQGIERSASILEPLREDTTNEFATRVARAWNNLLERKEKVRREADSGPVSMTLDLGASPLHLPQESPQAAMAPAEFHGFARRLAELEASLAQLHTEARVAPAQRPAPVSPAVPVAEPSVLSVPVLPAGDVLTDMRMSTRSTLHRFAPEAPAPADPEPPFNQNDDLSAPASAVRPLGTDEIAQSRTKVAPPVPSPVASASGYHEWTGHSGAEGAWSLQEEAGAALNEPAAPTDMQAFESTPKFTPPAPVPFLDDTYAVPPGGAPSSHAMEPRLAAAPRPAPFAQAPPIPAETVASEPLVEPLKGLEGPEFRFPHFVGKPGGQAEGRVAVTFEGVSSSTKSPGKEQPADAAANATAGRSLIVDLRALGAVELEE